MCGRIRTKERFPRWVGDRRGGATPNQIASRIRSLVRNRLRPHSGSPAFRRPSIISLLSGGLCCKSIFDISTRNKDSTWSDSAQTGSKTAARRFDCFTRPWCNGAGIPQCFAFHAFRTHPANSAAGLCYPSSRLQMIGRRTARLTPAAPPSATHPRRSRGPPAGGSGANPRDWRRAAWGRARADASSRAAPRPAGPRAHGSPR